ncbi:Putative transmembrane protein, partial [Pseudomonas sp. FEN]
ACSLVPGSPAPSGFRYRPGGGLWAWRGVAPPCRHQPGGATAGVYLGQPLGYQRRRPADNRWPAGFRRFRERHGLLPAPATVPSQVEPVRDCPVAGTGTDDQSDQMAYRGEEGHASRYRPGPAICPDQPYRSTVDHVDRDCRQRHGPGIPGRV